MTTLHGKNMLVILKTPGKTLAAIIFNKALILLLGKC